MNVTSRRSTCSVIVFFCACLFGCGQEPYTSLPTVDCWAVVGCPTNADLRDGLRVFAEVFPEFDPAATLVVEWYAEGHALRKETDSEGRTAYTIGEAPSDALARVTGWDVLAHELVHVQDWREGEVDYNHGDPPGVWTKEDDLGIAEVAETYNTVFGD